MRQNTKGLEAPFAAIFEHPPGHLDHDLGRLEQVLGWISKDQFDSPNKIHWENLAEARADAHEAFLAFQNGAPSAVILGIIQDAHIDLFGVPF